MKRLTYEGNFCDIAMCDPGESGCKGGCSSKKVWEMLKAYEDTGLTPEEVKRLKMEVPKNCKECVLMCNCRSWYGGTGCQFAKEIRP